ncbi:NAD(P)-binding domain-containing protein [Paraburkholderia sp. EG285A]|uniref:NAD(P)-binding domain-containing protein n=1 Tax=Paraburkholderia sp. EG285A TaxID=3237009 RepID=UPI0034D21082
MIYLWVSPRNAETAERLRNAYQSVHIGRDNQDIADNCRLLCLAVRPQVAEEVLSGLRLSGEHHVLSFIATWRHDRLSALMPEVTHIVRVAPLPMIEYAIGSTIVHPDDPLASEMFASLGTVIRMRSTNDASQSEAVEGVIWGIGTRQRRSTGMRQGSKAS